MSRCQMTAPARVRGALAAVLCAALLLGTPVGVDAARSQGPPRIDARAWILLDAREGERLAARAAARQLPIASATKLMTSYLALRDLPLDRELTAPAYSGIPAESVLGLSAGERISVRDLLVAMLLPSANDAAVTVAEGVAGSVPRFVKRMNAAARRLGLEDTSYANPIGLDDPMNGSSARDLAALTLELREDPRFRKIVAKPQATLKTGAERRTVSTRNTLLLSEPSVDGVKTGHTLGAGYVLVASAERKGVPLVSVVLGAPSEGARDAESKRLLDYGFSLYEPRRAVARGETLGSVELEGEEQSLEVQAARGERVMSRSEQSLAVEISVPADLEGPIAAGERVGRGRITLDGERVGGVPLLAARAVAAPGPLDGVGSPVATILIVGGFILVGSAFALAVLRGRNRAAGPTEARTPEQRSMSRERRVRRRQEG